jgi:hypothetical protein
MKKSKKKSAGRKRAGIIINSEMRDYSNEPMVIKKREESIKFLRKAGFPDPSLYNK